MMKRRRLTPKQKAAIRFRQNGICSVCREPLPETDRGVEYDHIHALSGGGSDTMDNIRAIHGGCHKGKTKADAQSRAKVARIRRKTLERSMGIRNARDRALARMKPKSEMP